MLETGQIGQAIAIVFTRDGQRVQPVRAFRFGRTRLPRRYVEENVGTGTERDLPFGFYFDVLGRAGERLATYVTRDPLGVFGEAMTSSSDSGFVQVALGERKSQFFILIPESLRSASAVRLNSDSFVRLFGVEIPDQPFSISELVTQAHEAHNDTTGNKEGN